MITLLTGASGFLGGWIARLLRPEPGALRILARPGSDLSALDGVPSEVVYGDLLDPSSLTTALKDVDRIFHAAGWITFKRRDAEAMQRVNYQGTVNLFDAALSAGVGRVVYTASIFGLGRAADPAHPASEEQAFNAPHLLDIPYLRAKRDAELAAEEFLARGLPLIRLYPGLALGPGDHRRSSTGTIDAWMHGGLPAIVTSGGICLIDVRDAAVAHIAAMERGQPGHKYLAAGHNVTPVELFALLEKMTGRPAPLFRLPPGVGIPLARAAEALGLFPALDEGQARLMACYWWYNDAHTRQELGITYRGLEETLLETVEWLAANPRVKKRHD
jgi:dihydroflavonol-4-reductase